MTDLIQLLESREARYQLADADAVAVTVEKKTNGEKTKIAAELIDISQGGLRLRCESAISDDDALTVTIESEELSQPLVVCAQVCWTTLAPKADSYLGCSIEPTIPQVLFDHLAGSGVLERRNEIRQETSIAASARSELDQSEWEASILNISRGGTCLLVSEKGNLCDRICLTVTDKNHQPVHVYVNARWQIEIEEGFVVGCRFLDHMDYLKLKQVADAHGGNGAPHRRR